MPFSTPLGRNAGRGGPRVLCLHGYHGSASVLRSQMAGLVSALPSDVQFVFVDAPSRSSGDFGWWHEGFRGWERTLDWARDFFGSQPPFDGLFGFSQGAALTGLLAAVNESERTMEGGPSWFQFAVMVGGFKSDSSLHADLFKQQLTLPTAHVMGRQDIIVPIEDSRELADQFALPLVLEHRGGHIVPDVDAVTGPLAAFLAARAGVPEDETPGQPSQRGVEPMHSQGARRARNG
jgi:hypothetical protein